METVNQEMQQEVQQPEKMFTQAEVDRIVQDRIAREARKSAETLKEHEAKSTETMMQANERISSLQTELDGMKQAEALRVMREKVSKDTGVPVGLLTGDTEDSCTEQAKAILSFAKPYPAVKDGGEVESFGKKPTTREQFADWFNSLS